MQIKHHFTGAVLFELRRNPIRTCVEAAVKSGVNLIGANLSEANLIGANLIGANLREADLHRANLIGANLIGANLIEANLSEANLRGANLRGANLRDANLRGANLRGANLIGANLREVDLRGVDLREVDLREVDLRGVDLREVDLRGANLRNHQIRGTVGLIQAGIPNNWFAYGFVDDNTGELWVWVGCRVKEISDGRAYWSSPYHPLREDRCEVLAALDYIEAVAKLRGWRPSIRALPDEMDPEEYPI